MSHKTMTMAWLVLLAFATLGWADHRAMQLGSLRTDSTPTCISLEWDITGDSDNDATCTAQYRAKGSDAWKDALPLFRVNYRWWYGTQRAGAAANMFAGSILFLKPDTTHEVKLRATDPDGGKQTKVFAVTTRAPPVLPTGGRVLHVVSGAGSGSGTEDDPIHGIDRAGKLAMPGDTFLLHTGTYGVTVLRKGGLLSKHVVWKPAPDENPNIPYVHIASGYHWFEGLTFNKGAQNTGIMASPKIATPGIVIRHCNLTGHRFGILLSALSSDWHIEDNTVVGDPTIGISKNNTGIYLGRSGGHVIAHNAISVFKDGIGGHPRSNCDIYGNNITDIADDAVECDAGYANIRIWNNRLVNYRYHGISFQPQRSGPWYIIRNHLDGQGYAFKFRVQDRFVLVNNTIINAKPTSSWMQHIRTAMSRNNMFVTTSDGPVWAAVPRSTREYMMPDNYSPCWMTDVDNDGFKWTGATGFAWDGKNYASVAEFAAAIGFEKHGVRIESDSDLIDAGDYLPNIHDGFKGMAPDIGVLEHGQPAPQYGPRY